MPDDRPIELRIWIGEAPGLLSVLVRTLCYVIIGLAVPVTNHTLLGGAWWVDVWGFFISVFVLAAAGRHLNQRTRWFESPREAAEWVMSCQWRREL